MKTLNAWDKSFKRSLRKMPIGGSKIFYYISGGRKAMATKVDADHIRWLPPDVGDSNAVVVTIDECVERYGYH